MGSLLVADAGVARIGDTIMAVATTKQSDSGSLHICSMSDCQRMLRQVPNGLAIDSIGSTGDGFEAVTGDDEAICFAAVEDETGSITTATEFEGHWYLVGYRPSTASRAVSSAPVSGNTMIWTLARD